MYTEGQRHGFSITTKTNHQTALYVIDRDIHANTITVAPTLATVTDTTAIELEQVIMRQPLSPGESVSFQIRYRQTPVTAIVAAVSDGQITLIPDTPLSKPAAGQSCVLYRDTLCLGGGIIQ